MSIDEIYEKRLTFIATSNRFIVMNSSSCRRLRF